MKIQKTLFVLFTVFFIAFSVTYADNDFSDCITIDGRTYKVSPDFSIPVGIDKDSPVKLNFSDETHELLSIERMTDDNSDNDQFEYHFGIVNAISRASSDLEYRVYVDGMGYLFTRDTRIDERIAFLEKYASVALVTKNGKVIICRVLASNTAVPEKDIFIGMVDQSIQEEDKYILEINGKAHVLDRQTETIGTVMIPGTWVFGYEINEVVRFISAITDEFPKPADVESFQGFVNFVGNIGESGAYYITIGDTTLRVLPDTLIKGSVSLGDFVSGYRIKNDILLLDKPIISFDRSRFEVYYQPVDDVVSVRDINSPTGQSIVSIILGEKEIEINSFTNVVGELKKGLPAMAVLYNETTKIVVACETIESGRVPVSGFISSITGTAPDYSIVIDGKKYFTSLATVIAAEKDLEPGIQVAGIANLDGVFDLLTCYGSVLPESRQNQYAGVISKVAANAFQIADRIIDYDEETIISGSFTEGKFALVLLEGEYAEMIYILPDDYSDFNYHTVSGVLNGIDSGDGNGKKAIRLDETVYYLDSSTTISKNLAYDEIGTSLYKGLNQVSIIDVLPKPDDRGQKFSGKISSAYAVSLDGEIKVSIGNTEYIIPTIVAFTGFSDSSRLSTGAVVEGYAYGNEILAIRIVKGAGLFGIINPPWVEYVMTGGIILFLLVWLAVKAISNKSTWHTGYPETGAGNTIILHDSDGQIYRFTADESLSTYIMAMHEKTISVKVRKGRIIEVR